MSQKSVKTNKIREKMKMRKSALCLVSGLLLCAGLASCHRVTPDAGTESVLIHKPLFFGKEGVDPKPVETGSEWVWFSTEDVNVSMVPRKYDENLEDVTSNDNTLLDFNTQIQLQVIDNKSPLLIEQYGPDWYTNVIQETYRNTVRSYISRYNPFDLMSNREVLDSINLMVKRDMVNHIAALSKERELPIRVVNVIVGRAIPNGPQKEEMDRTAAATQAKRTEESRREMLVAREAAERQRAIADKAYQKELGLNTEQFIQLRAWEIIEKKEGANIDVLVGSGGTASMWNVRR